MDEAKKFLEQELLAIDNKIAEAEKLMLDPAYTELAKGEVEDLNKQKSQLVSAMNDDNRGTEETEGTEDFKVVLMEARPGVGGEEAKIWMNDLLRMYTRYGNSHGWKVEEIDENVIRMKGQGAYELLKYETGVHRVQRVPETEAQGRIHTSTASIVVLPEVPESEVEIREDDLLWEFTRGGGHGGQNVNKVATVIPVPKTSLPHPYRLTPRITTQTINWRS